MDPHLKKLSALLNPKASMGSKIKAIGSAMGHYALWLPKQLFGPLITKSYPGPKQLQKHLKFIERESHHLARCVFVAMARYQQKLERKQLILGRLMDIGTDLFAMAATCSYAQYLSEKEGEAPLKLADCFCTIAERRVRDNFKALSDNDDKKGNKIAKETIEGEYRWLEKGILWAGPVEDK